MIGYTIGLAAVVVMLAWRLLVRWLFPAVDSPARML